jgi:hypothetical protein
LTSGDTSFVQRLIIRLEKYYKGNINARSRNHCCRGTTISITYVFGVCVCSFSCPARKAQAAYYIVICDLSGAIILFHVSHNDTILVKKVIEYKMCVFSTTPAFLE